MFNVETRKINLTIIFAIALTGIIVSALAVGLLTAYQRVPSYGSVKAVNVCVYWDEACTESVTLIDWGFVEPGATYTREVWVKNIGNTRIELNMTVENWSPAIASNHITLSWDREEHILNATEPVKAILSLSVSTTITETDVVEFSFDTIITGIEQV